jgi:putative phosphoribosyl transferase
MEAGFWQRAPGGGEPFRDRGDAGRRLAGALGAFRGRDDVIVLGLPRGGLPVAFEVARELDAPLDAYLVRKLGVPGHEELAMGAIAGDGTRVVAYDVVRRLGITDEVLARVAAEEQRQISEQERRFRAGLGPPDLAGRVVILVDDGLATGSTMRAAIAAVRGQGPQKVVVAVPVAPPETCQALTSIADEVICLARPKPFLSVGTWYERFGQTSESEIDALLERAREELPEVPTRTAA